MRKLLLTTAAVAAAILLLVTTLVLIKGMDYSFKSGATTVKLSRDMARLRVCGKGSMADYGGYWSGNSPDWYNASRLITDLIIENGVTHIGAYAFSGLSEVASVTIPNSVTSIGKWAFHACISLSFVIYLNPVPPDISEGTFGGLPDSACLYVPANNISAYRAADVWKDFKCLKAASAYTDDPTETFTDKRDGKTYKTVKTPDGKTWMAQNLDYRTDGGSWCYNDSVSYCKKYGRLYDGWATEKSCPQGWRLPSNQEWENLVRTAGGKKIAGKMLKSKSSWNENGGMDGNGTDDFGFSALPGGGRASDGTFYHAGNDGYWWTTTGRGNYYAYRRYMHYGYDSVGEDYNIKSFGFSVRCVADKP
jgi:uncharacterized protein (TIGR02145 family)